MSIYLPLAEQSYNIVFLFGVGLLGGFFAGFFGIGGGFITTPILITIGIPPAVAVASQASQLTATSISSGLAYWFKRQVDLRMAGVLIASGMLGVIFGAYLQRLLIAYNLANSVIPVMFIIVLLIVSITTISESLNLIRYRLKGIARKRKLHLHNWMHGLPGKIRFRSSLLYISIWLPLFAGLISGTLVGVLGVGGGFIMIPIMVYLIGMPTLLAIGTSFTQIVVLTFIATISHAYINATVDLVLSMCLIIGGLVGASIGTRIAFVIKIELLRILFSIMLIVASVIMAGRLIVPPDQLFSIFLL